MNIVRTAMLLAFMTALFMGVGLLIGGKGGMMIALLIAIAMNFFSYWNSDRMVLSMYGAKEVELGPDVNLFTFGRDAQSDIVVGDKMASRQHARIVRHQGQFWMVDMGSTNGIEYQGGRVDRRPIAEGDVYRICDHEIVFTYR